MGVEREGVEMVECGLWWGEEFEWEGWYEFLGGGEWVFCWGREVGVVVVVE